MNSPRPTRIAPAAALLAMAAVLPLAAAGSPGQGGRDPVTGLVYGAGGKPLVDAAVPEAIRQKSPLELPAGRTEPDVLAELADLASQGAFGE